MDQYREGIPEPGSSQFSQYREGSPEPPPQPKGTAILRAGYNPRSQIYNFQELTEEQHPHVHRLPHLKSVGSKQLAHAVRGTKTPATAGEDESSFICLLFGSPFQPGEPLMQLWDLVMIAMLAYTAFYTTYEVCFPNNESKVSFVFDMLVLAGFSVDIVIKFNMAYEDPMNNLMMTNRRLIVQHYLKGSFLLDFVSTFPWDLVGTGSGSSPRLIRLLRLMKLLRLLRTSKCQHARDEGEQCAYEHLGLLEDDPPRYGHHPLVYVRMDACRQRG
jgi:hypothetical protein